MDLIPASMINEFSYCPRRCYFQWMEGEYADCADILQGKIVHRRMESKPDQLMEEGLGPINAREIAFTGTEIGVACRIDLLLGDTRNAVPVDYKNGKAPDIPEGAYEPDRVQVCAQGLVLRENGFLCNQGKVFFVKSKKLVNVKFDEALVHRTRELLDQIRAMISNGEGLIPPPLQSSPKCNRCSMAGICLPDEVNLLCNGERIGLQETEVRKLFPADDSRVPIYVVGQGNTVRKCGDRLEIWSREGKVADARLLEISQVNLYGGVEITTPATVELMQRGVPVLHFTHGGWFEGICSGHTHKNVLLRIRQFQWAGDGERSLSIARSLVSGKIKNCRTMIMRNDQKTPDELLASLSRLAEEADQAASTDSLLGIEGAAAEAYFSRFKVFLKSKASEFSFTNRNKRPPRDPVNTILSYLYGILAKELFVTLLAVGLDPYLGFYHQPRYGRPALALDMMEEFRPLIADSAAITLFNKGELNKNDFVKTGIGISIKPEAKRKVVAGYERRIQSESAIPSSDTASAIEESWRSRPDCCPDTFPGRLQIIRLSLPGDDY
jgi:CRISPR-associated endonuclease Cas1/CRISPR-associated protein Cas4